MRSLLLLLLLLRHKSAITITITNTISNSLTTLVESPLDKVSQRLDKSSTTLTQIKNELNLVDIWRVFNPHKKEYSFIDPSRQGRDSRIDLWLISKANANNVISCDINQAPAPDHKAITLCVKTYSRKRGKGYWKMNNSVISDDKYKEGIIELYVDAVAQYANVPRVLL